MGQERSGFYNYYMRSEEWKKKAWAVKWGAGWRCERCGRGGRLEVHHKTYERLGKEERKDLEALCRGCHEEADGERKRREAGGREARVRMVRFEGWARWKYGEEWELREGRGEIEDEFEEFLERVEQNGTEN